MALTAKRRRFVDEYCVDGNQTLAYMRAGYTDNYESARRAASMLMKNPDIQEEIAKIQSELSIKTGITAEWTLLNLKSVVERCMQNEPVLDKHGNATGEYKFDATGANKALDTIGKSIGMFKERLEIDVQQVLFKGEDKLED